jgi:tRNA pseudouridine55 synthase
VTRNIKPAESDGVALAGILNVNKPAHVTSHDVVNAVRRLTGVRRVGHAGTLDPLATGVLVVCLGWATRLSQYLMDGTKHYRATLRLGVATDTYDADGVIVGEERAVEATFEDVAAALTEFKGVIEQAAPAYSALKHEGTPLYKLARRGQAVTPPVRRVEVHELILSDWDPPRVTLDVVCSKGTYVRSLANDLGERLGCGAHLAALVRLASGPFRLEDSVSLDELPALFVGGRANELFFPLERALPGMTVLTLDVEQQGRVHNGQPVEGLAQSDQNIALAVSPAGEPLAVLTYQADRAHWQPTKVFC